MEENSTPTDAIDTGLFAGKAWFDPIELGIRDRVRGFIQELLEQELTAALGRGRHERALGEPKAIGTERESVSCSAALGWWRSVCHAHGWRKPSGAPGSGAARRYLGMRGCNILKGWDYDISNPGKPVALQILDNGVLIGRIFANRFRRDLAAAGFGRGQHGFEFSIPGGLSPLIRHVIEVRREWTGGTSQIAKSDRGSQQLRPHAETGGRHCHRCPCA